jgi:hypothetical protein
MLSFICFSRERLFVVFYFSKVLKNTPASFSMGFFSRGKGIRFEVPTNFRIAPSLIMTGALPLLPLYAFVTRTGTTLNTYLVPEIKHFNQ